MPRQSTQQNHEISVDDLAPDRTCFVICPIGEPDSDVRHRADQVLQHIIRPAAEAADLVAVRSDHISKPGMITTQIIRHILNDAMVVADLSDHNSNVFYELALRHAFRKPVVQIISDGQPIPFDVGGLRTVSYTLTLDGARQASDAVKKQIASARIRGFESESPVTIAARLEELTRSDRPQAETLMQAVIEQVDGVAKSVSELRQHIWRHDDLKEAVPAYVKDRMEDLLQRYAREIELLLSVRQAGVIGIYKRRESAIKAFGRYIDEESREIMVIGSSLKGLLQKEEYQDIGAKLRFKQERGLVKVKFLLTHPIVADFRASQENRRPTEIGVEIIKSLETLKAWGTSCSNVRLYVGTPTCFAIKTTRQMLVNPYPYISVSYDSPCLLLEYSADSGADRPSYFFDEFNARHFGAWDTDLAVHIDNYDSVIAHCGKMLGSYAKSVDELISRGKTFQ